MRRIELLEDVAMPWIGAEVRLPALPIRGELNTNGAGDAFTAGLIAAILHAQPLSIERATHLALSSARQHVDSACSLRLQTAADLLSNAQSQ